MNRNRYAGRISGFGVNVVASIDALYFPPVRFYDAAKSFPANRLQTAISITFAFPEMTIL